MLNYQSEIVGGEFVTTIGHPDEFYVNLLFDRYIYRPMYTHMGYDVDIGFDCHTTIKNIVVFRIFLLLKVSEVKFIRMHRLLSSIPCLYYTTLAKHAPLLVFY